jgi:hypothetical protein
MLCESGFGEVLYRVRKAFVLRGVERLRPTAQQLYYAKENEYAGTVEELEDYGFRQGEQTVEVEAASDTAYCMQAPGGNGPFKINESTGKPEQGSRPSA